MQRKTLKLTGAILLFLPAGLFAVPSFFDSWQSFEVARDPHDVFAADLNGDGRIDLVSANYEANNMSVLIDDGIGGFSRTDYPIPGFTTSVQAADLDGDGDRDLAFSVNGGVNNPPVVSVYTNNGDGSFANRADYEVVKFPEALNAADFDGDGDLDLVVVNEYYTANSLSLLKNNGDGTFAPRIDYPTGGVPRTMAIGDFDGDADIDVMTANGDYPYTISVLKNNGDGSFAPKIDYPGGTYTIATTAIAADIDGDGDADLAVSNWNYTAFSIFKNNGDGSFAPKVDYGSGDFHGSIFGSDLDGDGDTDIGLSVGGALAIFNNDGNGSFGSPVYHAAGTGLGGTFPVDIDFDGDQDLVGASGGYNLSILFNDGTEDFMGGTDYPTGPAPSQVSASDLNGDSYPDLTVNNCCDGTVSVLLNNGAGNFNPRVDYATPDTSYQFSNAVIASDLDGDGDRELIATSTHRVDGQTTVGYVSAWPNDGNGTFGTRADYQTGNYPFSVTAGDIDGDGDNDLAVGARPVSVHFNNGDGTFGTRVDYDTAGSSTWVTVLLADLDGDGDLDLAYTKIGAPGNGTIALLKNNGSGTFGDKQEYITGVVTYSINASDLDGDGDLDISAANSGWEYPPVGNSLAILKNNGDGTFASKVDYPAGIFPTGVVAFDLTGDQYPDLVVTDEFRNTVGFLINNGDGTFRPKIDYGAGAGPGILAASDLDLDGDHDLAIVNRSGNSVRVLKNLGWVPLAPLLGDLNNDRSHTATDVVLMLNCVFMSFGACGMAYTDVNCDSGLGPADVVLELNKVFLGTPFPCGA